MQNSQANKGQTPNPKCVSSNGKEICSKGEGNTIKYWACPDARRDKFQQHKKVKHNVLSSNGTRSSRLINNLIEWDGEIWTWAKFTMRVWVFNLPQTMYAYRHCIVHHIVLPSNAGEHGVNWNESSFKLKWALKNVKHYLHLWSFLYQIRRLKLERIRHTCAFHECSLHTSKILAKNL